LSHTTLESPRSNRHHGQEDERSTGTGKSPTRPIVLTEAAASSHRKSPPKPTHIDVDANDAQLPVPLSILQQVRQTQIQRERQEAMDLEKLEAERLRQVRQAEKNRELRDKFRAPVSPSRRQSNEYNDETEVPVMRVLTVEPRKFPRNESAESHKHRMQHGAVPPLGVPAIFCCDDDVSATGGSIRLYNAMVNQHHRQHAALHHRHDIEQGASLPTKAVPAKSSEGGIIGWCGSRTELELFFIVVIVVAIVTLVVLFTMILTGKA